MLSKRLKIARNNKKLTQDGLAKKVNTTKATISNYENGHSTPSNDMLVLLSDILDVTTDYLLGRVENPELKKKGTVAGQGNNLTEDEDFQAFANNPDLERWYKDLPNSEEDDLEALKQMWEIIKKNKK